MGQVYIYGAHSTQILVDGGAIYTSKLGYSTGWTPIESNMLVYTAKFINPKFRAHLF